MRLYHEGKRTHFVPYGWNDKQSDIGQKKTHNVCAPNDQVRVQEIPRYLVLKEQSGKVTGCLCLATGKTGN